MKEFFKKNEIKIVFTVFIILSAVYLSLVWNNNVWMDEAFTASLVHTDFRGVIERSMADTLPPLYNIILKLATDIFGYTIPVMKITSVVPMLLTLLLGATVVRKRFGFRTALLFMLFITFMPLFMYYGVEIRMYSLGFFFATASGIYAYEIVCEPSAKNWTAFTLLSTLAGYSHHFAFVTVAFAYFYLLLYFIFIKRDKLKNWFLCLLATFLLYLPCLIVTLKQFSRVSGYFSMPDIDAATFVRYCIYPYIVGVRAATVLCGLLMLAALVIFFAYAFRHGSDKSKYIFAICSFTVYYGVLLFGTAVCAVMEANIFVDRYLFFSIGLLWLFAAVMLGGSDVKYYAALVLSLIIGVCSYSVEYNIEYGSSADEEILFLRDNIREGDVYFSIGGHEEMQYCIPFYTYLDKQTAELTFVYPLEEAINEAQKRGSTLWITVLDGYRPDEEDMELLSSNGLSMTKMADFEFDRYRCEMFRVD